MKLLSYEFKFYQLCRFNGKGHVKGDHSLSLSPSLLHPFVQTRDPLVDLEHHVLYFVDSEFKAD